MAEKESVGAYRVTGPVPAGRALEAYAAVDAHGNAVVVKLLAVDDRERFFAQMRAIAALDHPNLARVLDWGVEGELSYVVSEAIEGTDLASLVALGGPPAASVVADLGAQAAAALAALHAADIVHGGITPATMVRTGDGTLKVTDAGIGPAAGQADLSDFDPPVNAYFVSPEEVVARPVTPLSDVYALGASLYAITVGCVPFDGPNALAVAQRHVGTAPEPPGKLRPDLPAPLEHAVLKAMNKQPEQRQGSAGQLRRALLRAATAPADPAPAPASGERPKTPVWPWVIGLVLVTLVLGAIWLPGAFSGEGIRVPDVTGMTLDEARRALEQAGLKLGALTPDASDTTAPQGTVLSQDPAAGASVDKGSAVDIVVAGSGNVVVPDLVGLSQTDAEAAIAAAGLALESVLEDYSPDVPPGSVVEQTPAAGSSVPYGTAVTISVSRGASPAPSPTSSAGPGAKAVPNLVGLTQDEAVTALQVSGFAAVASTMSSDTVPFGQVMAQDPQTGVYAQPGTNVSIVVSTGPAASPAP